MKLLEKHFDLAFAAPNGVRKLRELILTFAMQGRLVPQDPNDQPASELLKEIEAEKQRLVKVGDIKPPKPLPEIKMDEMPYELPAGWMWVRLGSIAVYIQRGIGPRYSDIREIPVISQKCIQWSGFNKDVVRFIDPCTIDRYRNERFIRNGDLLWNSTGTGTIGRINIYRDELNEFKNVVADSHVTVIRLTGLCNDYVLNFLMSPIVQKHIEENASGTTNQIELNTTTVINQIIPLPPLAEQQRIIAKIDRLMVQCDDLVDLGGDRDRKRIIVHTAAINRLLNAQESNEFTTAWRFITQHFSELYSVKENVAELRKTILQLAVMGKLVRQDSTDEPASVLFEKIHTQVKEVLRQKLEKIVQFEPIEAKYETFPLPENWLWVRLGSLLRSLRYGTSKKCDYGSPGTAVLRIPNVDVNYGRICSDDLKYTSLSDSELQELYLMPNDLLMIRSNGSKSLVGRTAVVSEAEEGLAYAGYLVRLRSFPEYMCSRYLCFALSTVFVREQIEKPIRTTSGVKNINSTEIANLIVPLPPLKEQHRIVTKIDQLMILCDELDRQIDNAADKRADLLNAVMARV